MATDNSSRNDRAYEAGVNAGQNANLLDKVVQHSVPNLLPSTPQSEAYDRGFDYGETHPSSDSSGDSTGNEGGGLCFITTACSEAKGLPDNCHELEVLRRFRKDYIARLPEGPALLAHYRRIAPPIVRALRGTGVLSKIFGTMVVPAVTLIEQGRPEEALRLYRDTVLDLQRQATA